MHRPETWGYVQFSTAPTGRAAFRPDPAGPLRHLLHRIYYAERDYHERHGRWTSNLTDLGIENPQAAGPGGTPIIETTSSGFEVSALLSSPGGPPQRWHIREDSRIWKD